EERRIARAYAGWRRGVGRRRSLGAIWAVRAWAREGANAIVIVRARGGGGIGVACCTRRGGADLRIGSAGAGFSLDQIRRLASRAVAPREGHARRSHRADREICWRAQ